MTRGGGVPAEPGGAFIKRFAVYRDISPTYVLYDRVTDDVVALFVDHRNAERTAERLNEQPPRRARAALRSVNPPKPRYAVRPGLHDFERIVVDQWTQKIVWGPSHDMRAAERVAVTWNKQPITGGGAEGRRS
jgi:hypothetical protein